jgi:hypothetical protein
VGRLTAGRMRISTGDARSFVPAAIVPLPVLVPGRAVRVGAALVMGSRCWLASASIGMFFAPYLLLMIVAAKREDV